MKLTKEQEKELRKALPHATGECNCPSSSKKCIYWAKVDSSTGCWQTESIIKIIKQLK